MVGTVITTNTIIDNKANDIAGLQAQSIANQIVDAIVEAGIVSQSMPDVDYSKMLDVPLDLARKGYYIDVTENAIYVNTTDGAVSKSCSNFNPEDVVDLNIPGRIYSGSDKIQITYQPPTAIYKLDFGPGEHETYSPVETGSYMVQPIGQIKKPCREWNDIKYKYRIPILISYTPPDDLDPPSIPNFVQDTLYVVVKVVLTPTNFDYEHAYVEFLDEFDNPIADTYSATRARADILFRLVETGTIDTPPPPCVGGEKVELDYCVDFWNPDGTSVILLKIPMITDSQQYYLIYMYYGYEGSSDELPIKNFEEFFNDVFQTGMEDIRYSFFEDFNEDIDTSLPESRWVTSDPLEPIIRVDDDSCVPLKTGKYIITKDFIIPSLTPTNEVAAPIPYNWPLYVVEAKMCFTGTSSKDDNGSLILLSRETTDYMTASYVVSISNVSSNNLASLMVCKYNLSESSEGDMDLDVPNFQIYTMGKKGDLLSLDQNQWLRIGCYAHLEDEEPTPYWDSAYLNSFLYNFTTYAPLKTNLSYFDNNPEVYQPHCLGHIGLGSGLYHGAEVPPESEILVDWIRVYLMMPLYQPTVALGAPESINWRWLVANYQGSAENREAPDPFNPGSMLRDFCWHKKGIPFAIGGYGFPDPSDNIGNLPDGFYRITFIKGDSEESRVSVRFKIYNDEQDLAYVYIPETEIGVFEKNSAIIFKDKPFEFISDPDSDWIINAVILEKDFHGIKIE